MAVIKCKMKDGKLEVVQVVEFDPGDHISLEKPIDLFGRPDDCLIVKKPFRPGGTVGIADVSNCPGNDPKRLA
jgi:hypothetical protein